MRATEQQLKGWMLLGLDGDASAHATLLAALVPLLRTFYRRRMRDGADEIEDLVQETLIAVHTRRMTFDRGRVFSAWLFAVARHKMVDHFRRARRTCPIEGLENILVTEGFEAASGARMDIDRLLEALPPKQAMAIRATKLDGLSVADTAVRAGIGQSDVKISVHRGLKSMAARIKGDNR